ncbi:aminotransferase class I/II-fold pyridoxal phosphate-dependent enzyme, partial [bacterium]|nr:aminotransferase class I/II-fold pyridoxal phosphate-dependent enzyme [bacterium]
EGQVEVTLGTLSKALGTAGGYVVGSAALIDYLRNRARSLIYSTALPPAIVAAAAQAVDLVMSEEGDRRRQRLWQNVGLLREGLARLGARAIGSSPIVPIIIGDETATLARAQSLDSRGIYAPAIRYPTVPRGQARLRVTVTAAHTEEDIGRLLAALGEVEANTSRGSR